MLYALRESTRDKVSARLESKSNGPWICPACHGSATLNKGSVKVHHFKHSKNSTCSYSGESEWHHQGKLALKSMFDNQKEIPSTFGLRFVSAENEVFLGEVRPDLLVTFIDIYRGTEYKLAFELQRSNLSVQLYNSRVKAYADLGIALTWVVHTDVSSESVLVDQEIDLKEWQVDSFVKFGEPYFFMKDPSDMYMVDLYEIEREDVFRRKIYLKKRFRMGPPCPVDPVFYSWWFCESMKRASGFDSRPEFVHGDHCGLFRYANLVLRNKKIQSDYFEGAQKQSTLYKLAADALDSHEFPRTLHFLRVATRMALYKITVDTNVWISFSHHDSVISNLCRVLEKNGSWCLQRMILTPNEKSYLDSLLKDDLSPNKYIEINKDFLAKRGVEIRRLRIDTDPSDPAALFPLSDHASLEMFCKSVLSHIASIETQRNKVICRLRKLREAR